MDKPKVEICLSPSLYSLYKEDNQAVVVIDVIRASTSICTAINHGVTRIYPLLSADKANQFREKKVLIAGENQSIKLDGFDFGNSPLEFITDAIKGKELAMITTNGTNAILTANDASELLIGSFINFDSILKYLLTQEKKVLLLCSGWMGKVNIEDTLFAGKLANALLQSNNYVTSSDSVALAIDVFMNANNDLYDFIISSSPRLKSKLSFLKEDIKYCLFAEQMNVLPVYNGDFISNLK